jgi:hypothetical protein
MLEPADSDNGVRIPLGSGFRKEATNGVVVFFCFIAYPASILCSWITNDLIPNQRLFSTNKKENRNVES